MYQIKTLNNISGKGLTHFDENYVIDPNIRMPDGIIVRSASLHEEEFPVSLKAIARAGAGVNNIPIDRCSEQGIVVFNTPGANANAVKELVFAGLLMSARKIYEGIAWTHETKAETDMAKRVEKEKKRFAGGELQGKALGVVGLGAIGIQVANLAISFGMDVYGYDPFISVEAAWNLSRSVKHAKSLDELYKNSDYITVHVPLNDDTSHMINEDSISKMKNGVHILNFSRGGLVDNQAILDALAQGKVATYVTDFPDNTLAGKENVITIPHLGASTTEAEENCVVKAVEEIKDFLENGNILHSVNFPNVRMDRSGKQRVALIHRNVPKMLAQIAEILAQENVNIENMINKSKADYAYTLVDVDTPLHDAVLEKLKSTEGVIRVNLYA